MWENFVKIYFIHNVKRNTEFIKQRFEQTNSKVLTILETINAIGVVCDYSFKCQKIWKDFMSFSYGFQKDHPDIDLRLFLQDGK